MKFFIRVFLIFLIPVVIIFLIFSSEPIVETKQSLSAAEAREVKLVAKEIVKKFTSVENEVEISLVQKDINSLMAVATYVVPRVNFGGNLSQLGLVLSSTVTVELSFIKRYINVYCLFTPGFEAFEIDSCQLGSLPISGFLVQGLSRFGISLVFGGEVEDVYTGLLERAVIKNNRLVLTTTKSNTFKGEVKDSLKGLASLARVVTKKSEVNRELVQKNINFLEKLPQKSKLLSSYIHKLFAAVYERILDNNDFLSGSDLQEENTAALWALVIVYGNDGFSKYIGMNYLATNDFSGKTLGGRKDLSLHFLYSIFLEQLGRADVGLKVGELKELLDSNKGGSGFSFADLAADKAGLFFSQQLTKDGDHVEILLTRLVQNDKEGMFFPAVHDLPEGLSEPEFKLKYQAVDSIAYNKVVRKIDDRIANLDLYNDRTLSDFKLPVRQ